MREGRDRKPRDLFERLPRPLPGVETGSPARVDDSDPGELRELHLALEVQQQERPAVPERAVERLVQPPERRDRGPGAAPG